MKLISTNYISNFKNIINLEVKNYLLFTLVLLLASCQNNEIPSDILSQPKMESILIAIHEAEAKISVRNLPADSSKLYYNQMQSQILKFHKTDSVQFNRSFKFYLGRGTEFDNMYARIVDSLGLMEVQGK